MAHHLKLLVDAVAAVHISCLTRDVQRFATMVALDHADHFRRGLSFIHQATHAQAGLQAKADFGLHVREFFLE